MESEAKVLEVKTGIPKIIANSLAEFACAVRNTPAISKKYLPDNYYTPLRLIAKEHPCGKLYRRQSGVLMTWAGGNKSWKSFP